MTEPKPTPKSNSKDELADLMVKEIMDGSLGDSDKNPNLVPANAMHKISKRPIRKKDEDFNNIKY
jgi:hypothetical protein